MLGRVGTAFFFTENFPKTKIHKNFLMHFCPSLRPWISVNRRDLATRLAELKRKFCFLSNVAFQIFFKPVFQKKPVSNRFLIQLCPNRFLTGLKPVCKKGPYIGWTLGSACTWRKKPFGKRISSFLNRDRSRFPLFGGILTYYCLRHFQREKKRAPL